MMDCFLEAHEIKLVPNRNAYPEVFFLSSKLSAKSLSIYPTSESSSEVEYQIP
jgi:hypothetical protein